MFSAAGLALVLAAGDVATPSTGLHLGIQVFLCLVHGTLPWGFLVYLITISLCAFVNLNLCYILPMAHEIYQTEGIILDRRNFGEAEKLYIVLTDKFGKITAIAQGVRNIKSKLKFSLEPLSLVKFALVATGESWRIVDAEKIKSFKSINNEQEKLLLFSRLVKLISRMLQGQEKNQNLWNQFLADVTFLEIGDMGKKDLVAFEAAAAARILHNLGYIDKDELSFFINADSLNNDILADVDKVRQKIILAINEAVRSSHL